MNLNDLYTLLPEITLLSLTAFLLIVGLFAGRQQSNVSYYVTQVALIITLILTIRQFNTPMHYAFHEMYLQNNITSLAKIMTLICCLFALAYSKSFFSEHPEHTHNYCLLFLFATLGMLCLISSNHLLAFYLSLELLSLPLFALVALQQLGINAEAAMKYFALGAFSSALLLYGLSLIYGVTGYLWLDAISYSINNIQHSYSLMAITGIVFIIAGFAFKFGATPFHLWVPDVYQGAPASVVSFIGSAPKIAVLIIVIRLFHQSFFSLFHHWQLIWTSIAIASMALGNIAAIIQTNIRRMFAYSAISHMGYMLLGFITGNSFGYSASLFYVFSYALMTLASIGALIVISNQGFAAEEINDLRGLNSRNPWIAFMMLIVLFSMAGIPPSIGFFAKLGVLQALINVHQTWLAVIALIFAVIGSFYYIRVVKVMYFETVEDTSPLYTSWNGKIVLSINSLFILMLGIFPSELINLCHQVNF